MELPAVSTRNPAQGILSIGKSAVGNAISPPVGPDFGEEPPQQPSSQRVAETRIGRALQVFQSELRVAAGPTGDVANAYRSALTADDVAGAALKAARQSFADNTDVGSYALLRFRQRVESAASVTRQTVGNDADIDSLDGALSKIEAGLKPLDESAVRNRASSASVLSVDSRERQRSTIRIRTQEGDVVRLDLRESSRLTARDVAVADSGGSASRTDVALSNRSRLALTVKGDLSDSEYQAIRQVFAQAESIAGEFFGGDVGSAFALASELSFDTGQLARVKLRFRSEETVQTRFAQTAVRPASLPVTDSPATDAGAGPRPAAEPEPVAAPPSRPVIRPARNEPVATPAKDPVSQGPARAVAPKSTETSAVQRSAALDVRGEVNTEPAIDLDSGSFLEFFELLGDFLRSVADGFDRLADQLRDAAADAPTDADSAPAVDAGAYRYHFSQSFKLEIFKSVLELTAPDESSQAAGTLAAALIDGLTDATDASLSVDAEE